MSNPNVAQQQDRLEQSEPWLASALRTQVQALTDMQAQLISVTQRLNITLPFPPRDQVGTGAPTSHGLYRDLINQNFDRLREMAAFVEELAKHI